MAGARALLTFFLADGLERAPPLATNQSVVFFLSDLGSNDGSISVSAATTSERLL